MRRSAPAKPTYAIRPRGPFLSPALNFAPHIALEAIAAAKARQHRCHRRELRNLTAAF
jgi:hypothetical protein